MPHTLARRSERRAFSRDGAREFADPKPVDHQVWVDGQPVPNRPTAGPNRKARRRQGERHGDVSLLVHGPHDRAFLYSGTVNGGGQARVNAKRNARAAFWAEFADRQQEVTPPAIVVRGSVISERDLRDTVERQLRRLGY